ncbi:50S ribosomal protein L21 [Candidatus Woesebacteria bacterium]|nr:MAG: 50S ribosomal protein L21 [Candidatus Woesebacteria bacterium]
MNTYAVVRIQGQQLKVTEGQEVLVSKIDTKSVEPEVLLMVKEGKVSLGTPVLKDAKITTKILGDEKGKKVRIVKYKSKSRYRKTLGFRPKYTRLLIEKIA